METRKVSVALSYLNGKVLTRINQMSLDEEVASFIVDKTVDSGPMKNKLLTENFEKSPDDL